jgi:predicted amidophosphoribosyltransferase
VQGYAHFTWIPNQSRALSLLVESLKGIHMTQAWRFWAKEVLWGIVQEDCGHNIINADHFTPTLVPAPSSSGRRDHAFLLAQGLHELTGWELKNCLQRTTQQQQKELDKRARLRVSLQASEKISDEQAVLFIDDVMTTGATAQAAYLALGRPKNFFIVTLAYRHFHA